MQSVILYSNDSAQESKVYEINASMSVKVIYTIGMKKSKILLKNDKFIIFTFEYAWNGDDK